VLDEDNEAEQVELRRLRLDGIRRMLDGQGEQAA